MARKQVMGMVSEEAKKILRRYQVTNRFNQQGEAIESLLLQFDGMARTIEELTDELDELKAEMASADDELV